MPEQLVLLFQALGNILFHWENLSAVVFGTVAGIFLGAMPGLTSTVGIALLIPFSFYMTPLAAIAMMYGVNKGGTYGGSIPAILLHVPGTPAAACTQLDGYPLTRQGKHGKALQMAAYASAIGDTLSDIVLVLFTVKLAGFALKFGPPEFFTVILFALTIIGSVTGRSVIKGLLSAFAGLLLATVGLDPITSMPRFDFGITELSSQLPLVPILIGIFSVSEIIIQAEKAVTKGKGLTIAPKSQNPADNRVSWLELRSCLKVIFRSYFWGQLIGILPGIGSAISCWVGYGEAKRTSKHPERFGKGALEGVAASEAANNAVCGANLIPLLTLGVPGSTDIAVLMGVFLIHGINPGPRIFVDQPQLVYGIFASGFIAILIYLLVGLFAAVRIGSIVASISRAIIFPGVLVLCWMGSYAINTSVFDTGLMVFFGILGYLMRKFDFSLPALVIAFMLGSKFEISLRRSLLMSGGSLTIFLSRPICIFFIGLTLVGLFLRQKWLRR